MPDQLTVLLFFEVPISGSMLLFYLSPFFLVLNLDHIVY